MSQGELDGCIAGPKGEIERIVTDPGGRMTDDLVCVFVANGQVEAQQVKAFLEASGVQCLLRGESLRHTHGLTLDGLGRVEVLVRPADEEAVRSLLASAEAGDLRLEDDVDVGRVSGARAEES